ncbi:hypothetical protein [uncultured Aquimarina sp.]|uniref:hypothetical protein n=1 Tax=uncultured Aquimarina sp. TaxID=575652 RepID=UPI00260DB6F5|nr:hypothetical protein [uncultured Aquimarina sp.]
MEVSIFLAKFWGWYLIIFFFILSFNPTRIKQIFEDLKDQKFLITTSFVAIIIGLLNILFHNIWEPSWKFIITAIGWISLGIGLALFIFPLATTKWLEFINIKLVQVLYVLLFLTGIFLLNASYELVPY